MMRSTMLTVILLVLIGLSLSLGCSSGKLPTMPNSTSRAVEEFNDSWPIWQGGSPTQKYQNIDLSVLEWGPYPALGQEIGYPVQKEYDTEDRFWTIAVTIEQNYGGDPAIKYAWLDDIDNPDGGPPIASGSMYSVDGDDYEIAAAKVSASHYNYGDQYIEASVAFMYRVKDGDWDIGYLQGKWDSDGFPISGYSTEDIVIIGDVHDDDLEGTDDYHPDIAIDPATGFFTDADDAETGDIHIVWTGYCGAEPHPYRLNYIHYHGDDDEWDDPEIIYDDIDYAAWAPRIAIGNAGGGLGEIVGIVYNSYSSNESAYAPEIWHVGGAYWKVDEEEPEDANFMHLSMDDTNDAGFPRLDLAPRHCDAGDACGSIVFEQSAGGDPPLFRPLEINNVRNDYWSIVDPGYGGFFGAVSIHYPDGDPEATLSYFDQFMAGRWKVLSGRFLLEDDPPDVDWKEISNPLVLGDLTYDDFIDFLTIDTFQGGDIVTIDAGTWDNAYWLGFCDKIDAGAVYVNVAFGDSVP